MRHFIVLALVICAFAVVTRPAGAQFYSGNKLHEVCNARDETRILAAACVGYITGAVDFTVWQKRVCLPNTLSMAHLTSVVMTHLKEHPEKRELNAAEIVAAVTASAWPCPN